MRLNAAGYSGMQRGACRLEHWLGDKKTSSASRARGRPEQPPAKGGEVRVRRRPRGVAGDGGAGAGAAQSARGVGRDLVGGGARDEQERDGEGARAHVRRLHAAQRRHDSRPEARAAKDEDVHLPGR